MSLSGTGLLKKMLIYSDQSRNVYENKRNMDKLTAKKSDIYGNLTWILQKNSGFDGQFSLIDTFRAGFVRIFAAKISLPGSRAERSAYSVSTGKPVNQVPPELPYWASEWATARWRSRKVAGSRPAVLRR